MYETDQQGRQSKHLAIRTILKTDFRIQYSALKEHLIFVIDFFQIHGPTIKKLLRAFL